MALPFDHNQERKLIELAYLGEWMLNAHHDPEHQDDAARSAMQALLSAATASGIGRDVETGEFYLDADWTERLYATQVADYDDHIFWDELTERLAQRDLARVRGVATDEIDRDDDLIDLKPLEEKYRAELEDHGIDNLELTDDL
jgi:hypothetical protein